jgi:hypothetical protein
VAITGRPPSVNPRNRSPKAYDWTTVEALPFDGESPELPRNGRKKWHPETLTWWERKVMQALEEVPPRGCAPISAAGSRT